MALSSLMREQQSSDTAQATATQATAQAATAQATATQATATQATTQATTAQVTAAQATTTQATAPLTGIAVLITRPAAQGEGLAAAITALGGTPLSFPSLAILPPSDPTAVRRQLATLARYHLIFFVSSNAVHHTLALLDPPLPRHCQLAAVGAATAAALHRAGLEVALQPGGNYNSEYLLAQPQLQQMHGKRVLIVRGNGGRELFADTLRQRGAQVDYLEVYRRALPHYPHDHRPWRESQIITATSSEILTNLLQLAAPEQQRLYPQPLIVVAQRTAVEARELGFQRVILAARAADQAILEALIRYQSEG